MGEDCIRCGQPVTDEECPRAPDRGPHEALEPFKKYQRTAIAEMADWHPDFDMTGVSVSEPDLEAGSPKEGDKIARNPDNHDDKWLVAAAYFEKNFQPLGEGPRTVSAEVVEDFLYTLTETEAGADEWPEYRKLLDALDDDGQS